MDQIQSNFILLVTIVLYTILVNDVILAALSCTVYKTISVLWSIHYPASLKLSKVRCLFFHICTEICDYLENQGEWIIQIEWEENCLQLLQSHWARLLWCKSTSSKISKVMDQGNCNNLMWSSKSSFYRNHALLQHFLIATSNILIH